MSEAIVFISRNRVREGMLDEFTRFYGEMVKEIEAELPGTIMHLSYYNKEKNEITIVHLLANAAAMDRHMQKAAERARDGYKYIQGVALEVYGAPSAGVLEAMQRIASTGATLTVYPQNLGGYMRMKLV